MSDTLTFNESIHASPASLYFAMTDQTALGQWICNSAHLHKRVGGSFLFAWNNGYYASGEFTTLEPDKCVALTWYGKGEPAQTQLEITLTAQGDTTLVQMQHSGLGSGDGWDSLRQSVEKGWPSSLQALKFLVETGNDWRLMRRPLLGIHPEPLTPELAQKIGVPVTAGTYIAGVVDGLGAQAVGLRRDDVLVMLGGKAVLDYEMMVAALSPYKGGDTVAIEFYRGSTKHSADMLLSKRPMPEVPVTTAELMTALKAMHAELDAELDALVAGVPESVMGQRPAPEEWSVNENLAHLIWTERFNQMWMWGMVGGDDTIPWPDNNPLHLVGLLAVHPATAALITELKRSEAETDAIAGVLPSDFLQNRKPTYTTLARALLQIASHTREHFDQIRSTIEAVRV